MFGRMKLAEYLAREGLTHAAFAALARCDPTAVSRMASDQQIPRPELMERVVKVTRGLVTPNDFYGLAVEGRQHRSGTPTEEAAA